METLQFANPKAVYLLNKALLLYFYNLSFWDIPNQNLVPPIPGRADYMHYLADLLKEERSDDYVYVTLLDEETVLQPMAKIREVFPNAMHVERKLFYRPTEGAIEYVQAEKMTDTELFTAFFSNISEGQPTETMLALFERLNDRVLKEERER